MSDTADRLEVVTCRLGGQLCGLPIGAVRDVLGAFDVVPIPLAPRTIAGHINLRGRIVTAIDLQARVDEARPAECGGADRRTDFGAVAVVVEGADALYALLVDEACEVLALERSVVENCPPGIAPGWAALSRGVVRRPTDLLLLLAVDRVLAIEPASA